MSEFKKLNEILDFNKPIIYLDIEATNIKSKPKILQLSAIIVSDDKILKKFNMWSNPNEYINKNVLSLINKKIFFFNDKKPNKLVLKEFIEFCENYNQFVCFGNYDQRVFNYQYKSIKKEPIKLIDIQKDFFNNLIKNKKISISLSSLANALSIENTQDKEHDALLDSIMLYKIIKACKEIESYKNLNKIISKELLKPKIRIIEKNYKNLNDFKIYNNYQKSRDVNFTFYDLKINRSFSNKEENKKYISSIHFLAKLFNSKGDLITEINKKILFTEKSQNEIDKNYEWFFKKYYNIFFKNSIIIYDRNFNLFLLFLKKKYKIIPIYYYIPMEYIKYYFNEILNNNYIDFFSNEQLYKKLFSLIKPKWFNIIKKK